jgi:hypothetical protein
MRDTQKEREQQDAFAQRVNKLLDLVNANLSLLLLYLLGNGLYSLYKLIF